MALISLCFSFILFCVALGAVGSFFVFLFDVIKWHNQEKRTKISASAQKLPKIFDERSDLSGRNDDSDSGNNGTNPNGADCGNCDGDSDRDCGSSADIGAESTKRNASAIFDSWLQPGPRAD